jgi:hypothetical protein
LASAAYYASVRGSNYIAQKDKKTGLGYSTERQCVRGPDPVDLNNFLVKDMEI